jgi:hypothetical protein
MNVDDPKGQCTFLGWKAIYRYRFWTELDNTRILHRIRPGDAQQRSGWPIWPPVHDRFRQKKIGGCGFLLTDQQQLCCDQISRFHSFVQKSGLPRSRMHSSHSTPVSLTFPSIAGCVGFDKSTTYFHAHKRDLRPKSALFPMS